MSRHGINELKTMVQLLEKDLEEGSDFLEKATQRAIDWVRENPEEAGKVLVDHTMACLLTDSYFKWEPNSGDEIARQKCIDTNSLFVRLVKFYCSDLTWDIGTFIRMDVFRLVSKSKTELKEEDQQPEHLFRRTILNHFGILFPELKFLGVEKKTARGRIDIYAEDKCSKRPTLFELKVCGNPTGQLLEYAADFDNPRLIALTRKPIKEASKLAGVEYYSYRNGKLR